MSFMKPYIYGPQFGWRIETSNGTEYLPDDVVPVGGFVVGDGADFSDECLEQFVRDRDLQTYCEGTIQSVEVIRGFFGHYSAPGYMDCTPLMFSTDETELLAELNEYYGDEEETDE